MKTVSDFYKEYFNQKVYKISLDAGCTCPNRDGTLSYGGCIFCSASGSGDFAANRNLSIKEQIKDAKCLVDSKFSRKVKQGKPVIKKYIAYFQNFTNTYGNPQELLKKFNEAISEPDIVGIAIATRPDCLNQEILEGISELCNKCFVQVELGLQTASDKTAKYIRRGFETNVFISAVEKLHKIDSRIHVVAHGIFGLPGENEADMLNTVRCICNSGCDGIKITVLFVLENTDLEKDFRNNKFKLLEKEEYYDLLKKALKIMPSSMIIHRLTGDPPKKILVGPVWTCDKKKTMNEVRTLMEEFL